jgi:hypothetical protein
MKGNKICSLVLTVFAALWTLSILIFVDFEDAGFYFWGGLCFGLIAIILGAVVNVFISSRAGRNTTEIEMLPIYVTAVYVIISVIFNAIFVYLKDGDYNIAIPVVNVVAMVAYMVVIYSLGQYADRVVAVSSAVGSKTSKYGMITTKMAQLLGMCKDPDVRKKVLDLKQKVDYSNNLSQEVSVYEEEDFYNVITNIESMLVDGSSKEDIMSLIDEADNIWKTRNSKLSTMS